MFKKQKIITVKMKLAGIEIEMGEKPELAWIDSPLLN